MFDRDGSPAQLKVIDDGDSHLQLSSVMKLMFDSDGNPVNVDIPVQLLVIEKLMFDSGGNPVQVKVFGSDGSPAQLLVSTKLMFDNGVISVVQTRVIGSDDRPV